MLKILVLTDFSSGYSRRLLEGIIRYSREAGAWSFLRMPLYYQMMHGENAVVSFAKRWKADAIIAQLRDVNIEELNTLDIPIIVQNYHERSKYISNLTGDYYSTGVMAADYFLNRGYQHFAYYGYQNAIWSRERGVGYIEQIERAGYHCEVLENKNPNTKEWLYNTRQVGSWLEALPKPIALFACDDYYALQISETCNILNIAIPDEIALLGVDNDELLCNLSSPTLSSIVLDVENGGYQAAKLLYQSIKDGTKEAFNIVVEPLYVENRASTEKYAVADEYLQKVLDHIKENFNKPISVDDLVDLVPYSRRVLEKKFKETLRTSIYQCVLDHRINHFIKLLLSTDYHLPDAAIQSGFDDYKNVSRIFRKYKSISPAEYRKLYKKEKKNPLK